MNTLNDMMNKIVEFYQRNLYGEDSKGIDYISQKGITSRSALEAFSVGYSNGNLNRVISKGQQDLAKKTGLLNKVNKSRFNSTITFPLQNLDGRVVDVAGQSIGSSFALKSISTKSKGIGHVKALQVYDDVYAVDSAFLALKMYQEGYQNTIFTIDDSAMKMVVAKKVTFIAFKNAEEKAKSFENVNQVFYCTKGSYETKTKEALKQVHPVIKPNNAVVEFPEVYEHQSSKVLNKVVIDLNKLGYVGEDVNKMLAYLVSISRKLSRPLSAIIVSSSGAGKTGLMKAIANLVPDEEKLMLSRLTPQALYHMPKDALIEKLIVVDERNGSSMADYSIRTMQTSNVLTLAKPRTKDNEDGIKSIAVKSAYFESTTSDNINSENASRCYILHLDESPEATQSILEAQRRSRLQFSTNDHSELLGWHHNFQRGLKSLPVIIPFVDHLTFPNHKVVLRREQEKFLTLIEASALLHQANRVIDNGVIRADIQDYAISYELFIKVFTDMEREVSRKAMSLLKLLEERKVVSFTMRDALSISNWPYTSLYRIIQELVKYEYLKKDHYKQGQKQTYTRLDYTIYDNKVNLLVPPQQLSKTYSAFIHKLSKQKKKTKVSVDQASVKKVAGVIQSRGEVL